MSKGILEADLRNIPRVPFTETWKPIHHSDIVEVMQNTCIEMELEPQGKHYQISDNGMDAFATWHLQRSTGLPGQDSNLMLGWRNSMQKYFSYGIVAGENVMNCSNMCFWGDFCEHRKHTSGLDFETLQAFTRKAIQSVLQSSQEYTEFLEGLAATPLHLDDRKVLVYDMIAQGALPPSKFNALQVAYAEELQDNKVPDFESVIHLHGAVTRALRGTSIHGLQVKTRVMNEILGKHTDTIDQLRQEIMKEVV